MLKLNEPYLPVALILLAYLITGLMVYDDFGVYYDEDVNYFFSRFLVKCVKSAFNNGLEGISDLKASVEYIPTIHHFREHGPIFEMVLGFIEDIIGFSDSRDVILFRRASTFIVFFISAVFFGKLLIYFSRDVFSPAAGLFLYLFHPRIFAHSFYNATDISLLSFFTISLYTFHRLLYKPSAKNVFFHALASSLAVNVRLVGLLIPLSTVTAFFLFEQNRGGKRGGARLKIAAYIMWTAVLSFLMNPLVWDDPGSLKIMFSDTLNTHLAGKISWDYTIKWFFLTTPLATSFLFILGSAAILLKADARFRDKSSGNPGVNPKESASTYLKEERCVGVIALLILFFSLSLPAIFGTYLYDSWRHHFFIYSSIIYVCFTGLSSLSALAKRICGGAVILIFGFFVISIIPGIAYMVDNHPNQHVYANLLKDESDIEYCRDYWGLSYRQGFQYLLDSRQGRIRAGVPVIPGLITKRIIKPYERDRLLVRQVVLSENDFQHLRREGDEYIGELKHPFDYYLTDQIIELEALSLNSSSYVELFSLMCEEERFFSVYELIR